MRIKNDNVKSIGIFVILIIFLYLTGIGCPIRFLFGICCPGCGLTRAYVSLMQGDLKLAFIAHPLFILPPIIYLIYISNLNSNVKNAILLIMIVLFLILYFFRLFGGIFIQNNDLYDKIANTIYIDIKNGFVYNCFKYFFYKII